MSGTSPYMHAAMVGTVHGSSMRTEPSDDWPYMRTAAQGFADARADPLVVHRQDDLRNLSGGNAFARRATASGGCSPPGADWNPAPGQCGADDGGASPQQPSSSSGSPYTKLVKSSMLPFSAVGLPKHVFKVRETTKLLLFLGVAVGGVLLLDLSARLIVSIAHNRCAHAK